MVCVMVWGWCSWCKSCDEFIFLMILVSLSGYLAYIDVRYRSSVLVCMMCWVESDAECKFIIIIIGTKKE